jgi:hypothetical protein
MSAGRFHTHLRTMSAARSGEIRKRLDRRLGHFGIDEAEAYCGDRHSARRRRRVPPEQVRGELALDAA